VNISDITISMYAKYSNETLTTICKLKTDGYSTNTMRILESILSELLPRLLIKYDN